MELMDIGLISYLALNGLLQLYFVHWVLWRNKKLTMLLVEYYKSKESLKGDEEESLSSRLKD